MAAEKPKRRICRTPEEAFQAGWEDGERLGERMPPHLIDRMIALHRPYVLPATDKQDPAA